MTNQQTPEIYTLHTVPNEGKTPWFGIYALRADAEHDAKVMRDVTGRDWSVVRLVVADTAPTPPAQAADSVLEDAARWRMVVLVGNEVLMHPDRRSNPAAVKAYMDAVHSGLDFTGAVDVARKQGANHD